MLLKLGPTIRVFSPDLDPIYNHSFKKKKKGIQSDLMLLILTKSKQILDNSYFILLYLDQKFIFHVWRVKIWSTSRTKMEPGPLLQHTQIRILIRDKNRL